MNLKLNKQKIVSLTESEMNFSRGGDQVKRSNRKLTNCRYSQRNTKHVEKPVTGGGCIEYDRCASKNTIVAP